jgi:hypothetical protein
MKPKPKANIHVGEENGEKFLIPMNRKARRKLAKAYGKTWQEAKHFKKLKPKTKTDTGYADEDEVITI